MFHVSKKMVLTLILTASSQLAAGSAFALGCQHPYCNGPGSSNNVGMTPTTPDQDPGLSAADRIKQELADVGVEQFTASDYKPGTVRHIVLFRYASTVTPTEKREVIRRFLALKTLAKRNGKNYIVSIDTGGEISGEGADQGLEQGFIVTFRSQGDRNYYVGQPVVTDANFYEPAHQAFKDFVGPLLDQNGAVVFDFAL
jgi:hypothetical protein